MIRVMLVDDHALVRMGFRMLLADAQVEVVCEAGSGEQAVELAGLWYEPLGRMAVVEVVA